MWKPFWTIAGLGGGLFCAIVWVSANTTFLFRHPLHKDARIEIDRATGAAVLVGFNRPDGDAEQAAAGSPTGLPRVQVPQREHDFGTMNPLTVGRHDFVIRNAGTAPLTLRVGPTTCRCTLAKLAKSDLAPGQQTTVTLEWNTGRDYNYEHSGTIITNDPEQQSVELVVRGHVTARLAADVSEIVVPPMTPDTPASTDVLIYSQTWDRFDITKVECSLEGAAWDIAPPAAQSAPDLKAKSVQRLRLTIPGNLPAGKFTADVRLAVTAPGEPGENQLEIPLHGSVEPRMSLVGGQIDRFGYVDLGSLREGQGRRVRLLVKVRDSDPDLSGAQVAAHPEFLRATLSKRPAGQVQGLYDLEIEIPADAPSCQFRGNPRGEVRIDTGHPRLGSVKLGVTFAILPNPKP